MIKILILTSCTELFSVDQSKYTLEHLL